MSIRFGICAWTQSVAWPEVMRFAELVDDFGFDHLWTVDHLFAPHGDPMQPILEGWSVLSGWATRTKHVQLGLFVAANTFRPPAVTAKLATTLDHMSDGRAILALGAGWFEAEHRAYGTDFGSSPGERIGWLDESASIIRRALDGDVVTVGSGHYQVEELQLLPRPIQRHLPIMIGGGGEKRTLRTVARHADIWNTLAWPHDMERKIGILEEHCRTEGRDFREIELTLGANILIRPDVAAAEAVLAEQKAVNHITPDTDILRPEQLFLGSVDDVVERLRRYVEIGVTGFIVEMPAPFDQETLERIANDVRPRLDRIAADIG